MKKQSNKNSIFYHLAELKKRIMLCFLLFLLLWGAFFYFAADIFNILMMPLSYAMKNTGGTKRMIYTAMTEGFFTQIKLAAFAALMVIIPLILNQVWKFISPALYKKEKNALRPFFISSTGLFYIGAAFVYFIVIPVAWKFFLGFQTSFGQTVMPIELEAKISEYLSLITSLIIAFGLAFQLPVILVLLIKTQIISIQNLIFFRKYAVVISFIVAAILTPPDIISQIFMAIALIAFYETAIFYGKKIDKTN